MNRKIDELETIITMEAELAELIAPNLRLQQIAIIHSDADTLGSLISQLQELMLPFENLETARMLIISEIAGKPNATLNQITSQLPVDTAERILKAGNRMFDAFKLIQATNQENKSLLDNALNFVRENVKLLTENHTKQLVDCRI